MAISDSLSTGYCVAGLSNGNIVLGGEYSDNLSTVNTNGVIFMLDEFGEKLWTLKLGDPNTGDAVSDMEGLIDGGIVAAYYAYDNSGILFNSIIRVNNLGNVVWSKKIAGSTNIVYASLTAVTGGFILYGSSISSNISSLVKVDLSGNFLWSRTINSVEIINEGVSEDNAGNIHLGGSASGKGFWAKLSGTDGSILNSKTYSSPNFLAFTIAKVIQNDSLLLVGTDYTNNCVLFKTDLNGNPGSITQYKYGNDVLYPISIHSSGNGEFVLSIFDQSSTDHGGILARFSSGLQATWSKIYAVNNNNTSSFGQIDDIGTGFVVGGTYTLNNKQTALLVKTNFSGDVYGKCCPKEIDLIKSPATVSVDNLGLTESPGFQIENFTVTRTTTNSVPTPVCITNEKINASDTLVCPGQCITILLGGSEQGVVYSWDFTGGTPTSSSATNPGKVCYNNIGNYPIKLSLDNCVLDSVNLKVDNTPDMFPNAFSPNGDGPNDTFKPIIDCAVEEYRLQIFSRWGDLLFETYDLNEGWNGEANGEPAPVDVYVYRVEFYAVRDGVRTLVFNKMKEVTLIR